MWVRDPINGTVSLVNGSDALAVEKIASPSTLYLETEYPDDLFLQSPESEVLDQSNLVWQQNASVFDYQSFTAGETGLLSKIRLYKSTTAAASGTVSIYEGTGTGGTLLASESFSVASTLLEVTFSTPASVTATNVYSIGYSGTNVTFQRSILNPYAGGRANWSADSDVRFQTYVTLARTFLKIDNPSRNIGIDVESPTEKLDIDGNLNLTVGNEYKIDGTPISADPPREQGNIFYVNASSGSDTDSGKSTEETLASWSKAVDLINALGDAAPNNPYAICIIGGDEYTEDKTIPSYVILDSKTATQSGNITMETGSVLHLGIGIGPSSGAQINVQLASGVQSDGADIYLYGFFIPGVNGGFKNNASEGELRIHGGLISPLGRPIIPNGASGDYIFTGTNIGDKTSNSSVFNLAPSSGTLNLRMIHANINHTGISASDVIFATQGLVFVECIASHINCKTGKIYTASSGPVLDFIACDFKEAVASTKTAADVNMILVRADDDRSQIVNDTAGILLKATGSNVITTEVNGGTPLICHPNKIEVGGDIDFTLGGDISSAPTDYVNLGTTPQPFFVFQKKGLYLMTVNTVGSPGHTNTFMLVVDYNLVSNILIINDFNENNGAVSSAIGGGNITFTINVNNYTPTFDLVISQSSGNSTIAASTSTTGTTRLSMTKIANI
jgi:hypothetical protein